MASQPIPSLTGLATLLKLSASRPPPSLTAFLYLASKAEDYNWFCKTVRETLPDEADQILALPNLEHRLQQFATSFSKRHFPLSEEYIEYHIIEMMHEYANISPWSLLRHGFPFEMFGVGYEEFHEVWQHFGHGTASIALLIHDQSYYAHGGDSPRVPWLEEAAQHIPTAILERLPPDGIPTAQLKTAVEDTEYTAVTHTVDWLTSTTGNPFLDFSPYEDDFGEYADEWTPDIIATATRSWQEAEQILDAIHALNNRLTQDLPVEFDRMISFILDRLDQNISHPETEDHGTEHRPDHEPDPDPLGNPTEPGDTPR